MSRTIYHARIGTCIVSAENEATKSVPGNRFTVFGIRNLLIRSSKEMKFLLIHLLPKNLQNHQHPEDFTCFLLQISIMALFASQVTPPPWSKATPMLKCLCTQISFTYIFRSLMPRRVLMIYRSGELSKGVMSVRWC